MQNNPASFYDVVIMGGGPGGATLGALLAKKTQLKVAIFDSEVFPREHIGESFAHPLIPVLEESGALPKVLASSCYVMKYGGVFNWDDTGPNVAFFDHANFVNDGVHRWAIHANRSEFDQILLNHARELGVSVFEGTSITRYQHDANACRVLLHGGREVSARVFVDASGRHNSIATGKGRAWLSSYKNIAIWNHYVGCRPTQGLAGDWNVFQRENRSPIGCFAFDSGWCWYIPVPKLVAGERIMTHSIGIVTTPAVLKLPGRDYTDEGEFFEQIRQVPLLKELVAGAKALSPKMMTATNYSMMNEHFCNFDERWILVGDASYFVDPLFSSGVAFAAAQASAVALVIRNTLEGDCNERQKRDLWSDYDREWHGMAETYALSIDQWYHAIARKNPGGVYWSVRGQSADLKMHDQMFSNLLNTAFTPDLLQVMTKGTRDLHDLDREGPWMKTQALALAQELLDDGAFVSLGADVELRPALGVDVPGFKAFIPPPPFEIPQHAKAAIAEYWKDPVKNGDLVPGPHDAPLHAQRFQRVDQPDGPYVRSIEERDGGTELYALLKAGPVKVGELRRKISGAQDRLLRRLSIAKLLTIEPALAMRRTVQHDRI